MAVQYWIKRGEKVAGPYSAARIKELADGGTLRRDDLMTKDRERWVPAALAKGLFPPPEPDEEADYAVSDEPPPVMPRRTPLAGPAPRPKPTQSGGFFGPEKAALRMGALGGLLLMVIAIVWFVLGLMIDRIFFYPPVLFCIGLFGFFKGLFSGHIAGRRD